MFYDWGSSFNDRYARHTDTLMGLDILSAPKNAAQPAKPFPIAVDRVVKAAFYKKLLKHYNSSIYIGPNTHARVRQPP